MSEMLLTPYQTQVELVLAGSLQEGGRGILMDERGSPKLQFPPVPFALLVVLIEKARDDERRSPEPWAPVGFLSAERIYANLRNKKVPVGPKRVPRHVFRLREIFRNVRPSQNGDDFGSQLIEFQEGLGYRLSTPASLVRLELAEDV